MKDWIQLAFAVMALLGAAIAIARVVVTAQSKNTTTLIKALTDTQTQITHTLANHMKSDQEALQEINRHMGATVEALRGIQVALVSGARKTKARKS